MPVAGYGTYCRMIDRALEGKFAYPAVNVTWLTTANAALKGLAGRWPSWHRTLLAGSRCQLPHGAAGAGAS
jgi:hypothetical protein